MTPIFLPVPRPCLPSAGPRANRHADELRARLDRRADGRTGHEDIIRACQFGGFQVAGHAARDLRGQAARFANAFDQADRRRC